MSDDEANPLISSLRTSESSPQVQLHPLVLLSISDYTTRHTLREQEGPIVGAILGQQHGREVTMEVAFECKVVPTDAGEVELDEAWFRDRLEQFMDVYKVPALDLVGWFTLGPKSGPQPHVTPIQQYLMSAYNETAILLLFHPNNVYDPATSAGKLPLTIYEPVWESTKDAAAMEVDDQTNQNQGKALKFRELGYTVETGEAEMISVDFVARGGGNATAIDTSKGPIPSKARAEAQAASEAAQGKGKAKAVEKDEEETKSEALVLSPEEEEILSSITAKKNAIRMLHARIHLLHTYLSSLPPSYLTDPSIPPSQTAIPGPDQMPIDHTVLRNIQSLLSRLAILEPPATSQFNAEAEETRSDTALVELLSRMTSSVADVKELGRKVAVVENTKQIAQLRKGGLTSFGDAEGMGASSKIGDTTTLLQTVVGSGGEGKQLRERKFWQ